MLATNRAGNANHNFYYLKLDNETNLSHSRSPDAAVPGPHAVWVFPAGAVRGDGGIWHHGISLLPEQQGGGIVCVWSAGIAVPTDIQDCTGKDDVECGGCRGGSLAHRTICVGEAT